MDLQRSRPPAPFDHQPPRPDFTLSSDDLVILDDSGVIGLAGTMGGLATEIDDATTAIALEAAHFDSGSIARMARRHRLSSEASRRFERGVVVAVVDRQV